MNPWAKFKFRLTKREKYYVFTGVSFIVIFLIIQFGLFPLLQAKARIKRSVQVNEKALTEIISLSSEYRMLRKNTQDIQKVLALRKKDFALFSFLEKQAGRAGVKANIKYMKPSTSTIAGPYKESSVEMKLEEITLKQIVNYLYFVESPEYLVRIKRLSIKQSKGNPEFLTALMYVITYK
jgi:general secretion pathway protein M